MAKAEAARPWRHGVWLWKTRELLSGADRGHRLGHFCRMQGVNELYLQLPYRSSRTAGGRWRLHWDEVALRRLVVALSASGTRVFLLDGSPQLALAERHGLLARLIESIASYNRRNDMRARVQGLRLDIEPYLLPRFSGAHRSEILQQYLDMLRRARLTADRFGLKLAIDIPFWFDQLCVPAGGPGQRRLSELVIDLADDVAIMAYRTQVVGDNGIVALVADELRYASLVGKTVLIGLETAPLADEIHAVFSNLGNVTTAGEFAAILPRGAGHVRIVWPFTAKQTASHFPGRVRLLPLSSKRVLPAARLSFARLGARAFWRVQRELKQRLARWSAFGGLATHAYASYRALVSGAGGSGRQKRKP